MLKRIIQVLVALFILFSLSCKGANDPSTFPFDDYDFTINNLRLGVAFPPSSTTEHLDFSKEHLEYLGVNLIRIDQKWNLREPERDSFNWSPLERRLDFFDNAHIDVLVTLEIKDFPDWTNNLSDAFIETEFRQYVKELLRLYGEKITYIQMGNEWNWEIDTHLNGIDSLFISLANILYEEVQLLPETARPEVFSGSLSIGAMMAVSYHKGDLQNVEFEGGFLFDPSQIDDNEIASDVNRMINILSAINFDVLDLHFYDDYWNWELYLDDMKDLLTDASLDPSDYRYAASEFGGPHPDLESEDEHFKGERLISYIQTLDRIGIDEAFYFKMVEDDSSDPAHPNSFLINSSLETTIRYEVIARFTP